MRIGILTDIHENTAALKNAFRMADLHKVDELACLGDIAGYDTRFYGHDSRSAGECVRLVKSNCQWVVAGNHDLHAAGRLPVYTNGFSYPSGWFSMSTSERKEAASGRVWCYENEAVNDLDAEESDYLRKIPEMLVPNEINAPFLFSHYIYPDLTGSTTQYVKRNLHMGKHWDLMKSQNLTVSFIGHSHNFLAGFAYKNNIPFLHAFHSLPNNIFQLGNEPVVILLPPLSGEKGRTGFSIIDTDNMKLSIITTLMH
ncbi:MAG: metallophosphoesterase [Bacteroidota bacterium]